jgi:hypothetical protein
MRRLLLAFALAALVSAPTAASARAKGDLSGDTEANHHVSYSYWTVEGATVHVRFVLPTSQAHDLAAPSAPPPTLAATSSAIGAGLSVTATGGDCIAIDQGEGVGAIYAMALTPGVERFELIFRCPSAGGIVLHDHLLFARAPGQRGGGSAIRSFTIGRQDLALPAGALTDQSAGAFAWRMFVGKLGAVESFFVVAGLLLLAWRWRDLGYIAAGLSAGYGVSLMLKLSGLVVARNSSTEVAVDALMIILGCSALYLHSRLSAPRGPGLPPALFALAGLAATAAAASISPASALTVGGLVLFSSTLLSGAATGFRSSWLATALAALFGLLDGGRMVNELVPLHLPPLRLAPMLAGDDLGAMAAILAITAAGIGALWIAKRRAAFVRPVAEDLAGATVLGFGVFRFVSHIYS